MPRKLTLVDRGRVPRHPRHVAEGEPVPRRQGSQQFVAKMGADAVHDLLANWTDELSYSLRHEANTETSQQRKSEKLKRCKWWRRCVMPTAALKTIPSGW